MYTDPDPQFLAPARRLEIGQECPVFSTFRTGNPNQTDCHCMSLLLCSRLLIMFTFTVKKGKGSGFI